MMCVMFTQVNLLNINSLLKLYNAIFIVILYDIMY